MYAASVDNRGLEQTIEVLGDVVLRPQFSPEEMEFCEMAIRWKIVRKITLRWKIVRKITLRFTEKWPIISSVPDTSAPHFGIHRPKM